MDGGEGDDKIGGGNDADTLTGGDGEDSMEGGLGNDLFMGVEDDSDDERITSSDRLDADTMRGGAGDDTFILGSNDDAEGGEGADTFVTGNWTSPDDSPDVLDFDVTEDVFVVLVPEGTATDNIVVVENINVEEPVFTVYYNGYAVAFVHGAGFDASHVSVVETEMVEYNPPVFENLPDFGQ